ncbi:serine/threonine-protein phosphatase [bacterium]|nr:MAG: serine/threonine-protein phosphatase [bacterium]
MPRTTTRLRRTQEDQLSFQIETLQNGFKKISAAATLADLAKQSVRVLRRLFRKSKIDLAYRPQNSVEWQLLVDGKANGLDRLLDVPGGRKLAACTLRTSSTGMCAANPMGDKSAVGVTLQGASSRTQFSDDDAALLRVFLHLFETAYQGLLHRQNEKALVFSLNHRVLQLNSLIDTGIEVSKLDQGTSLQQLALERAASLTNASKGLVRVKEGDRTVEESFFPDQLQVQASAEERHTIATSFTFANRAYTFELFEKESRRGIIPFEDTDQMLLDALARQVHASLENRFLLEKALENQRFEQDMAVAAAIQKKIIPEKLPALAGYDLAGVNIPSKSVGGDYYDCIPLANGSYALVIADVSGKGVPAALLVSSLHAYLSAYLEAGIPLSRLVQRLNKVIWRASTDDKFITAFFGILFPDTGELEVLNAGHNPAYLLRQDGTVQEFGAAGLPLGMLDMDFPYQSERVTVGKGERLLLYTDGITEASDEREEFYDIHAPLRDFFLQHKPEKAESFIAQLIGDIRRFTGSAPQSDDITALYLRRLP